MEYLLYKFVMSCIMAYIFSLIVVNVWNGIVYILNRIKHDDSEWVDNNTLNEVSKDN